MTHEKNGNGSPKWGVWGGGAGGGAGSERKRKCLAGLGLGRRAVTLHHHDRQQTDHVGVLK